MRRFRIVLYPFLLALYSVLAVAFANTTELMPFHELLRPLELASAIAAACYVLALIAGPDAHRRAAGAGLGVLICTTFWLWGHLFDWRVELAGGIAAIAYAVLWIIVLNRILRRGHRSLAGVSRYLNLFGGVLLVWSVGSLLWRRLRYVPVALAEPVAASAAAVDSVPGELPNVVMMILDKYTGATSLRRNFGYDNTPFEDGLRRRGFFVPRAAHANYTWTFLALSSMLNWEYLDAKAREVGVEQHSWSLLYPMIEDNRTWRAMKRLGYEFVFLPTATNFTGRNRYADVELPSSRLISREFEAVWVRTTILLPILRAACSSLECSAGSLPSVPESAASIDWKFDHLPMVVRQRRPVFVFAHIDVPHEPYIYDAECRHRLALWPERDDGPDSLQVKMAYVDQISCVNRKVDRLVDALLANSSRPVVIMLQADHGHGRMGRTLPALADAPSDRVAERIDVFAAYRFPGAPPDLLYDSITPVNAVRALMRNYFRLNLPPLEDATYWSSYDLPYQFTRVR